MYTQKSESLKYNSKEYNKDCVGISRYKFEIQETIEK